MRLRFALAATVAVLLGAAGPAAAADLYALTGDDRLVRFDPLNPWFVERELQLSGEGGPPLAITTFGGALMTLDTAGSMQSVRQSDGVRDAHLGATTLPAGEHVSLGAGAGTLRLVGSAGTWKTLDGPGDATAEQGETDPPGLELVATAVDSDDREYAIDADGDRLMRRDDGSQSHYSVVGELGIDVEAPAAFEFTDGGAFLVTDGQVWRVDRYAGAASLVGPLAGRPVVRDVARVEEPGLRLGQTALNAPDGAVTGVYEDTPTYRVWRAEGTDEEVTEVIFYNEIPPSPWNEPGSVRAAGFGTDFDSSPRVVTVPAGVPFVDIPNPVYDDDLVEGMELIMVRVGDVAGPAFGVLDNGDAEFSAAPAEVDETDDGFTVVVRRVDDPMFPRQARVQVAPVGGTAGAADFAATPQEVVFSAGQEERRVVFALRDDREVERPETVELAVRSEQGRALEADRATARVTIRSDDTSATAARKTRRARSARITVRRLRLARRVVVPFMCSHRCTATAELRVSRRTARALNVRPRLARAKVGRAAQGPRAAAFRIGRRTLARLRRAPKVRATIRVRARYTAGGSSTARRTITLRR